MYTSRHFNAGCKTAMLALALTAARATTADVGSSADAAASPKENFLTSLKQAFKQDFDKQVVRGQFDVGTAPDVHRYYCLVDAKTGERESSGVAGELELRKDGMTGIKPGAAVSLYSCDSAEEQGILVTSGYVLVGSAAGGVASRPRVAKSAPVGTVAAEPTQLTVDVAGIKLGMSVQTALTVLRAKQLQELLESTLSLGDGGPRYTNQLAAWTIDTSDDAAKSGESIQVMFTPVPGHERVMAIVRTLAYAPSNAVREASLADTLAHKYGEGAQRAATATWRVQSDGSVQTGDNCERRSLYGGLAELTDVTPLRANAALRTTPEEFRFQIEHCGVAIITADDTTASAAASAAASATASAGRDARVVSRLTVSAYSPALAFEGATAAAQLLQAIAVKAPITTRTAAPTPSL